MSLIKYHVKASYVLYIITICLLSFLFTPRAFAATAIITEPMDASSLSGVITIKGQASGDLFYLEYGQGYAPTSWQAIGSNPYPGPVNGSLANWDTRQIKQNGTYTLRLRVVDSSPYAEDIKTVTFDINNRISVVSIFPEDNATGAPSSITITAGFDQDIDPSTIDNSSFFLKSGLNIVNGVVSYNSSDKKASLQVTGLSKNTTYEINLTSAVSDILGNKLIPLKWTFTTRAADSDPDVHGGFANNVNTCINCHGTHNASSGRLITVNIEQYCYSCHDGTSAPKVVDYDKSNKHKAVINNNAPNELSCNGCHDPHLPPRTDNFNLYQNFYTYDHLANYPNQGTIPNSSEQELCEDCHQPTIVDSPNVSYRLYNYRENSNSGGTSDDYSLCFRCHKDQGLSENNIEQYYKTGSGHYIKSVNANKPVGWKMPCSDCHDKHGSDNLKLIKEELGDDYTTAVHVTDNWNAAAQRTVCQGCHNNTTEMYGIVVTLPVGIDGHQTDDSRYCTQCHGSSAIQGAHAPG